MASVEQRTVDREETDMRLDRWFKAHFPGLGFGKLQKLLRSGQIRVDGAERNPIPVSRPGRKSAFHRSQPTKRRRRLEL